MKKLMMLVLACATGSVSGTEFDPAGPILCAVTDYNECTVEGCESVTASSINAPTFMRLNAEKQTLQTITQGQARVSQIDEVELVDGKLLMAGIEQAPGRLHEGIAYSISVTIATGNLAFSAVSDDIAFTGFGACIKD